MPNKLSQFWLELKRRKVIRVITVYAATAFVIIELTNNITEPLNLPEWVPTLVIVLLAIGFLISIVMSWIFDITPGGVEKTKPVKETVKEGKLKTSNGWKVATYISVLIIAALVIFEIVRSTRRPAEIENLTRSIAILPFENLGLADNCSTLQDALPIALILELQNVEGFSVKPRRSTLEYKETSLSISEIGKELNVTYILMGYLQQQGTKVQCDIHLIRAATEEVILPISHEMELDDIFKVQRDISKQVASSLKNKFIPEKRPTDNTDAWLAFLTGQNYYWKDDSPPAFNLCVYYYGKAVQLDTTFSAAWAKLSTSHCLIYFHHFDHREERLLKARKALAKANEIDPTNPDVIFAEGYYAYVIQDYKTALQKYEMVEGRVTDVEEYTLMVGALYRRMQELDKSLEYFYKGADANPRNNIFQLELAETNLFLRNYELAEKHFNNYVMLGGTHEFNNVNDVILYLMWKEGTGEARQALKEAKELIRLGTTCLLTYWEVSIDLIDGRYDEAINALMSETADSINDQFIYVPKSLLFAKVYYTQDKMDKASAYYEVARIHLERKISESPQDSRYHSSLGIAYAGLGQKAEAIREGQAGIDLMPITKDFYKGIFRLKDMARIYTMVGEYQKALEVIDHLLSMPSLMSVNLVKKEPAWEPLWGLPDFKKLIEEYSQY